MPRNNARPVGRNQNNNYVENKTVLAVFSLIGFFLLLATCSSNNNPTDSAANNSTPPVSKELMNTAPEETLRVKCRVVGVSDGDTFGVCQHSCHPYLNQATKTSLALTRLDRRTGLRAVG